MSKRMPKIGEIWKYKKGTHYDGQYVLVIGYYRDGVKFYPLDRVSVWWNNKNPWEHNYNLEFVQ